MKKLIALSIFLSVNAVAQTQLSKNWFNEDPQKDKFAGVSSDLAHEKLLKGKQVQPVIVAVIDGGTDVNHPDLKDNIWVNEDELPGNGIDDDHNGYADDVNGWNFIGGANGDVDHDNLEGTRLYRELKPKYDGKSKSDLSGELKSGYGQYQKLKTWYDKELKDAQGGLEMFTKMKKNLDDLRTAMGSDDFTADDVMKYNSNDQEFSKLKSSIASAMSNGVKFDDIYKEVEEGYNQYFSMVNYHLNLAYDPRSVVGDDYAKYTDRSYGNNNVIGPEAEHGTHVAGIIGALRDNNIGMQGVASSVRLMIVRVVPDGDERDKDVANGIRYAVDNGARVINMSFGKPYSPGKKEVDEAIRYAASKDVLLVHAAGNDAANIDKVVSFPNPVYISTSTREPAWIEVGALSSSGNAASFSNYGMHSVDVFAPGVDIYSTLPGGQYGNENGTSMASPMVAGIAALVRAQYPKLTAVQVRQIIMDSAIPLNMKTKKPGSKKKVKYSKLCISGGMANGYRALQWAEKAAR